MQLGVVVGAGEWYDVDRCADPGGFQDVAGAVDGAEVDGDVAGKPTMSPGCPCSQATGVPAARWLLELSGAVKPAWPIT